MLRLAGHTTIQQNKAWGKKGQGGFQPTRDRLGLRPCNLVQWQHRALGPLSVHMLRRSPRQVFECPLEANLCVAGLSAMVDAGQKALRDECVPTLLWGHDSRCLGPSFLRPEALETILSQLRGNEGE
eukprot:13469542-Alexandrium_andersonii.AAC.1